MLWKLLCDEGKTSGGYDHHGDTDDDEAGKNNIKLYNQVRSEMHRLPERTHSTTAMEAPAKRKAIWTPKDSIIKYQIIELACYL